MRVLQYLREPMLDLIASAPASIAPVRPYWWSTIAGDDLHCNGLGKEAALMR